MEAFLALWSCLKIFIIIFPSGISHFQKQPPETTSGFVKKGVLKNFASFTGERLCCSLFIIKLQALRHATSLKKAPTQMFSCEICKIFENTHFEEHLQTTASTFQRVREWICQFIFTRCMYCRDVIKNCSSQWLSSQNFHVNPSYPVHFWKLN